MSRTEKFLDYYENRIKEDREASFFIFLTALSKNSDDPQNVFLRGDSGIGKTWVVTNVLDLFNDKGNWMLGGLSPTALVHSYGELLDENDEPILWTRKPSLEDLKDQMQLDNPTVSKTAIKEEYYKRLEKWNERLKNSKYVVDLNGKLLVFLDAPRVKTFNMLRPILSHDKEEISYRFTDRSGKGQLRTQHVVIRGWPATIFCTTDKTWMEDLATRSLTITPKSTKTKLRAACILIGEDVAFPINNHREAKDAKMRLLLECLQSEIETGKFAVAVPYAPQIGEIIPLHQPRIMRDFKHIVAFIKLNAVVNHKNRPKITGLDNTIVLATYEDFKTVLDYFEYCEETTVTGLGRNIINVFNKAMVPLGEFTYVQLVDKCKEVLPRPLSSSTLRNYIMELAKVGYVDEQPNPLDKRSKIIRVIKQDENVSEYVRKEFGHYFRLESFKGWLKGIEKNCVLKGQIYLNKIPKDQWNNDVEDLFNEHYVMGKNDNVFLAKQDTIVYSEKQAPSDETSTEVYQNYKTTEKDGNFLNFNVKDVLKIRRLTEEENTQGKCVACSFEGPMDYQATLHNRSWGLLCGPCGYSLVMEMKSHD